MAAAERSPVALEDDAWAPYSDRPEENWLDDEEVLRLLQGGSRQASSDHDGAAMVTDPGTYEDETLETMRGIVFVVAWGIPIWVLVLAGLL